MADLPDGHVVVIEDGRTRGTILLGVILLAGQDFPEPQRLVGCGL
jgi:hypothetical protein